MFIKHISYGCECCSWWLFMFYTMFSVDTPGFLDGFFFRSHFDGIHSQLPGILFSFHSSKRPNSTFNSYQDAIFFTNIITIFEVILKRFITTVFESGFFWCCYSQPISITFVNKYLPDIKTTEAYYFSFIRIFKCIFHNVNCISEKSFFYGRTAVQCSAAKQITNGKQKQPKIEFYVNEIFHLG